MDYSLFSSLLSGGIEGLEKKLRSSCHGIGPTSSCYWRAGRATELEAGLIHQLSAELKELEASGRKHVFQL